MSYRPTISVYLKGKIIDIGYYRNWMDKGLFFEAMAIAAFLGDCRTRKEYLARRYGVDEISYSVAPETFDSSEKSLKWLEECSEMPVLVDLSAKCIYTATATLPEKRLRQLPSILEDLPSYGYRKVWKQVREITVQEDPDFPGGLGLIDFGEELVREPVRDLRQVGPNSDYYTLLNNCRVPYGGMDMRAVRRSYLAWTNGGTRGLSEDMLGVIRRWMERSSHRACGSGRKTIQYRR